MQRYVEVQFDVPVGQPQVHRLSALAAPVLVLTLSGDVQYSLGDDNALQPVRRAMFTGPLISSASNRYEGPMHGFMIRFRPWGVRALFGIWGMGLANEARDACDAAPPDVRPALYDWLCRLEEAPDFAHRTALANAFLLRRLRALRALPDAVAPALSLIERTSGTLSIAELSRKLDTPESTLRRQFVETTGVSPKLHAQIIRFRHAFGILHGTPETTWADVVSRFGYTDQAHFIREHRRFAGVAPTRLVETARFMDRSMGLGDDRPRS